MGTRARVGILNEDGSVTSIYTHWDGYPDHHGPILTKHYATEAKVRALMALGNLSVLAEEIGEKHPFDSRSEAHETWCRSYGRDRGETDVAAREDINQHDFLSQTEEFTYLFREGAWWVWDRDRWIPVIDYPTE